MIWYSEMSTKYFVSAIFNRLFLKHAALDDLKLPTHSCYRVHLNWPYEFL